MAFQKMLLSIVILCYLLLISEVKSFQFSSFGSLTSPHSSIVVDVAIAPDKSFIVTGASQTTLKIWNYTSLTLITSHTYSDIVTCVSINSADYRIFIGINDGTIKILNGTTFLQIQSYAYPNAGKPYIFSLPKYQDQFYIGGNDVTIPKIHTFNGTDYTQIGTELTSTFSSGTNIVALDSYFNLLQNTLTFGSNQNSAPFRMVIYNANTQIAENYDQANGAITFTKFCNQGQILITGSADKNVRMYKYNSDLQKYSYTSLINTISYGIPTSITCQNQQYANVAAGQHILMLNITEEQFEVIDSFLASASSINCMFQLNGIIVFGCIDGSVGLVTVNYSIIKKNMNPVIISGSILSAIVFFSLVIAVYHIILHEPGKDLERQSASKQGSISASDQQIKKNENQSQKRTTRIQIQQRRQSVQIIDLKQSKLMEIESPQKQMKLMRE